MRLVCSAWPGWRGRARMPWVLWPCRSVFGPNACVRPQVPTVRPGGLVLANRRTVMSGPRATRRRPHRPRGLNRRGAAASSVRGSRGRSPSPDPNVRTLDRLAMTLNRCHSQLCAREVLSPRQLLLCGLAGRCAGVIEVARALCCQWSASATGRLFPSVMRIPLMWNAESGDLERGFRRSGTLVGAQRRLVSQ